MSVAAKASAAPAKAASSRERKAALVPEAARAAPLRAAPLVSRSGNSPCACGGHCPKCVRNSSPAIPASVNEDPAAEQEAERIAQLLLGSFSNAAPLPPPGEDSPADNSYHPISATFSPGANLGPGQPLPDGIRRRLEPALGVDLSALRLHTGANAHTLAKQQHARAFTYGSHLVFGSGEYAPSCTGGLKIIVHEIVHAVQQSSRRPARMARRTAPTSPVPRGQIGLSSTGVSPASLATHPWAGGMVSHQARPRGPPAARAPPFVVEHNFSQPRVQCVTLPGLSDISRAVVHTAGGVVDSAVDFGSSAVGLAVDVGEGALELGSDVVEGTAEFFIGLIDEYAPGLMEFLRGGVMSRLTDLFCRGLDAVIGGLISSLEDIDFVSVLEQAFASAQQSVTGVLGSLGNAATEALGALMQPVVDALDQYGPGIIDAVSGAGDSVNGFFSDVWQSLGVPALDFLGDAGGAVWKEVTDLLSWLWDSTSAIREAASEAWSWVTAQFGLAWDSTSGIREWLAKKATAAWDSMLEELGPLRGPAQTLATILVLLSPMGPVVVATQVIPPLWDKLLWLWQNWNSRDILVRAQDALREQILPGIISTVSGVASAIASAASWLAGLTVQVAQAFGGVLSVFGTNHCLESVTRVLTAVSHQFTRLAAWADGGFKGLGDAIASVFNRLVAILQPILDFLVRLLMVAGNPPMLPLAITGAIWLLVPNRLKPPVINFVLDLILAFLRGMPTFLPGLWPMASLLKGAALGFLASVRIQTNELKIAASNKIAGLMAGGGIAFVAGFGVGLLEGILDGVLDPFRIIWMLIRLTVAACRAIGTLLARLSPDLAARDDRFRTAIGAPAANRDENILGSFAVDVGLGERTTPTAVPASGANASTAPPAPAAAPAPTPSASTAAEASGPAIVSHTGSADFARLTGTRFTPAPTTRAGGETAAADLLAGGPFPSDAEVAASVGPGMARELSSSARNLDGADTEGEQTLQSSMQATHGSPRRLSEILGEVWDSAVAGATNIGASIAEALIRFILLPDYELGSKIGWVAGFVIFQLILMYLTAGVSAAGEAASPILRAVVSFLDLGGEILGVMGRALGRLAAPVGRLLAGAGRFVERIPGLGRIFSRFTSALRALLRFGEHAGGAIVSRVRRVTDPIGERVMRGVGLPEGAIADVLSHGASSATTRTERAVVGDTADDLAARATRDATDASASRAARDTTEDAVAQDTRRAASEGDDVERAAGRETDDAANLARRKAEEMPGALAELGLFCQANDAVDTPMPLLIAGLYGVFQARYPWIRRFYAERLGLPHHYTIFMVASPPTPIDTDYTDSELPVGATADASGVTFHERGPDPIVERRPLGSGEHPVVSASPQPRTRPDVPESAERFPDLADEAPRLTTPDDSAIGTAGHGGLDEEALSPLDRPRGAPPIESGVRGDMGEVGHAAEVVGTTPRRASAIYPDETLAEMRQELLSGDISLHEFAERFPEEGAAQVFFPNARGAGGGRYIDHMYIDGPEVVFRESKNVSNFRLLEDYQLQLDKDVDLMNAFAEARVEWRISGDIDPAALNELQQLAVENPRFTFRLDTPGPYVYADGRYIVPSTVRSPEVIRRDAKGPLPRHVPQSIATSLQQQSCPLEPSFRCTAENYFGTRLEHVRIHNDNLAATAAAESHAHALAIDNHIILGSNRHNLDSTETQATLAHEIVHTLQPKGPSTNSTTFIDESSSCETEARRTSADFMGRFGGHSNRASNVCHRTPTNQTTSNTLSPHASARRSGTVLRDADEDTRRKQALSSVDWMSSIPPIVMDDNAPVLIAWAQKQAGLFETQETTDDQRIYIAQGLLKVYAQLQEFEPRAQRDTDHALLYHDFLKESETPWAEDRATRLDEIPPFRPLDLTRWRTNATAPSSGRSSRSPPRVQNVHKPDQTRANAPPPANAVNITFSKQKEMTLRTDEGQRTIMAFVIAATRRGISGDQIGWLVANLDLSNRWNPPPGMDFSAWADQFDNILVGDKITLTLDNRFTTEVDVLITRMPTDRSFMLEGYRQGVLDARGGLYLAIGTLALGTLAFGGGALIGTMAGAAGGTGIAAGGLLGGEGASLVGGTLGHGARYAASYLYLNAPSLYGSAMLYGGAALTGVALSNRINTIRANGWDSKRDIPGLFEDVSPLASGYMEDRAYNGWRSNSSGPKPTAPAGDEAELNSGGLAPSQGTAQNSNKPPPAAAPPADDFIDELAVMRDRRANQATAVAQSSSSPTAANDNNTTGNSGGPQTVVVGNTVRVVQPQPTPQPTASAAPQVVPVPVASAQPQPVTTPVAQPAPQIVPTAVPSVPAPPSPQFVPAIPDPAQTALSISLNADKITQGAGQSATQPAPTPVPVPAPAPDDDDKRDKDSCSGPTGLTRNDPIPIRWFKPFNDRNLYPSPIVLGGEEYRIDDVTTLPRGEPLGVLPVFRPRPGKIVQLLPEPRNQGYDPVAGRFDSTTQRYRDTLCSYGFDWGHRRNLQADHVMDLQWGPADDDENRDQFNNLWPLDAPANTSAGSMQNNLQMVSFCETRRGPHRTISLETMKAEARANPQQQFFGRYFVITTMGL